VWVSQRSISRFSDKTVPENELTLLTFQCVCWSMKLNRSEKSRKLLSSEIPPVKLAYFRGTAMTDRAMMRYTFALRENTHSQSAFADERVVGDLPRMKIGTLIDTLFLLLGDTHELGGYFASTDGTLKILGNEIVWGVVETKPEETETPEVVIN